MDTIITQVQSLAASANEAGRKKLIDSLRNLQYSIETPNDTLRRFGGLVGETNPFGRRYSNLQSNFKLLLHALVLI